jgi:hypothetical protein
VPTVGRKLPRKGPRPDTPPRVRGPSRWDAVDWSRPDVEIAADLGVSKQAVHKQRHRRGLPARGEGG